MSLNIDLIKNFLIPVSALEGRVRSDILPLFNGYEGQPDWRPRPIVPLRYVHTQGQFELVVEFLLQATGRAKPGFMPKPAEWKLWDYIGIGLYGHIELQDILDSYVSPSSLAYPPCYVVDANTMKFICAGVSYESIIGTADDGAEVCSPVPDDSK